MARFPAFFEDSHHFAPCSTPNDEAQGPYFLSHKGINITLSMIEVAAPQENGSTQTFYAILNCKDTTDNRGPLGILLRKISIEGNEYMRTEVNEIIPTGIFDRELIGEISLRNINVLENGGQFGRLCHPEHNFYFHIPVLPEKVSVRGFKDKVYRHGSEDCEWDSATRILRCHATLAGAIYIGLGFSLKSGVYLLFGIDSHYRARCDFGDVSHEHLFGENEYGAKILKPPGGWDWNKWLSQFPEGNTSSIDLKLMARSKKRKSGFCLTFPREQNTKSTRIHASIGESKRGGQNMFSICINCD